MTRQYIGLEVRIDKTPPHIVLFLEKYAQGGWKIEYVKHTPISGELIATRTVSEYP